MKQVAFYSVGLLLCAIGFFTALRQGLADGRGLFWLSLAGAVVLIVSALVSGARHLVTPPRRAA